MGKGARIGLLGSRHDNLAWRQSGEDLVISVPAIDDGELAFVGAYTFRIEGASYRVIVWLRTVPAPPRVRPRTNSRVFRFPGMKRSRSIVGIAVGVSSLVLVAAGMVAKRAIDQLAVTGDAVVAAKERELSFERLLSTLNDAETGQRGYLLSGSDEYLAPYEEALREVEGRINTVVARNQGGAWPTRNCRCCATWSRPSSPSWLAPSSSGDWVNVKRRWPWCAPTRAWRPWTRIRTFIDERVLVEQANVERLLRSERTALRATVRSSISVSVLAIALMLVLAYVVRRDSMRVRQSEERLATTLRSIGDAVIATDEKGLVTMTNPVAEKLTGWPLADARGRPLDEVFNILNEQTRAAVESPVAKVLREGGIVGLANHTVLIHRDGHETAIEDSGAPICDASGTTTGVVLVFRDATEERAAQNALHEADRRKDEFLATLAQSCAIRWHPSGRRRRWPRMPTRSPSRSAGVSR